MKPLTQIAHVMSKDVRQLQWPLLAYVTLVAVATAHAVMWPSVSIGLLDWLMVFVVLLGVIVAALLVQTDSPIRADAYWASRPLAPWAVLGAKIAGALLFIIGIGLVGQFFGLRAYDLNPRLIPAELAASARTYALCLLVAMVLAALTEDFRSFVVAVVAVPIALLVLGMTVLSPAIDHMGRPPATWVVASAAVAGGAAILAFVYRTRYSRALIWLPAFVVASCGILSLFVPSPTPARTTRTAPRLAQETPIALSLAGDAIHDLDARGLQLSVAVTPPPAVGGLILANASVTFHLRDGSAVAVPVDMPMLELYAPRRTLGQGESWIGATPVSYRGRTFAVRPDDSQRNRLAAGIASVDLDAQMIEYDAHVVGTLPLRSGAQLTSDGTRVAIDRWSSSPHGPEVAVRFSSIAPDPPMLGWTTFGSSIAGCEFALVNPSRREALALISRSSTSDRGALVLPGSSATSATMTLTSMQPRAGESTASMPGDDWLRDARLVVQQWSSVGQHPVHASLQVR